MKSDLEIFGDGTPMKGALAIGGSVDDDDLAPKFGKMKVNDKKAKSEKVKKEDKLNKKAKEEGAERKNSFFGIKMTLKMSSLHSRGTSLVSLVREAAAFAMIPRRTSCSLPTRFKRMHPLAVAASRQKTLATLMILTTIPSNPAAPPAVSSPSPMPAILALGPTVITT